MKCTVCGSKVTIDEDNDFVKCSYCGAEWETIESYKKDAETMLERWDNHWDGIREITQFLEFLTHEKNYHIARFDNYDRLQPIPENDRDLIAEYYEIDLEQLEKERRKLLESVITHERRKDG